jgi:hypothetical protein
LICSYSLIMLTTTLLISFLQVLCFRFIFVIVNSFIRKDFKLNLFSCKLYYKVLLSNHHLKKILEILIKFYLIRSLLLHDLFPNHLLRTFKELSRLYFYFSIYLWLKFIINDYWNIPLIQTLKIITHFQFNLHLQFILIVMFMVNLQSLHALVAMYYHSY